MNKKLLTGFAILAVAACNRSIDKKASGNGSASAEEVVLVNPVDVEMNNDKAVIDVLGGHKDYTQECGGTSGFCNGLWVLSQMRCNDEVVTSGFKDQPVAYNFHGIKTEVQYSDGKIENGEFSTNSGVMTFNTEEDKTFDKSFTAALKEGVLNIYINSAECPSGPAKMIYLRADSEKTSSLLKVAKEKASDEKATFSNFFDSDD